jgi:hypothetical protein
MPLPDSSWQLLFRPRIKRILTQGLGIEIRMAGFHVATFQAHTSRTLENGPDVVEVGIAKIVFAYPEIERPVGDPFQACIFIGIQF